MFILFILLSFRKIGMGKDDLYFWKQMGKAALCTYTLLGLCWLWNETSPLGWWTLKPRPKVTSALDFGDHCKTCFWYPFYDSYICEFES